MGRYAFERPSAMTSFNVGSHPAHNTTPAASRNIETRHLASTAPDAGPAPRDSARYRRSAAHEAGRADLDYRGDQTVRALAADPVHQTGNVHPATAITLAPADQADQADRANPSDLAPW
jgi:hypothetical protein